MTDHIHDAIEGFLKIWPKGEECEHAVAREVFKSLKNAATEWGVTQDTIKKLQDISVDIGGIGGSQDGPDPIKAVAIIAELKDRVRELEAELDNAKDDRDCFRDDLNLAQSRLVAMTELLKRLRKLL